MAINYGDRIPNNVDLNDDRRLRRALEVWQPSYLKWWRDLGPHDSQEFNVYLRTATHVGARGWAHFDYVKMPDYRWGIFLAEPEPGRTIPFGDHKGKPVWQDVPGEYRPQLRRLIVTQGDTEPASVEQQRFLGSTCPSMYDLRNLLQVNVEEGRHLWAMVYLLQAHFGRDGREEAEALLQRHSGDADHPRMLGAFNEPTPDWLAFFMFTFFTDRDGKCQLACLAESGFDPLARTCQFMLTEEAYHMFVGETGVLRVAQRTAEVMRDLRTDDPGRLRLAGVIDLPTIQRYLNFHYCVSLDLFGSEISTNVATYFGAGLKGRYQEAKITDDHLLTDITWPVDVVRGDRIVSEQHPARTALNDRLRKDYIDDCQRGVERWNHAIHDAGVDAALRLPHLGFNRRVGQFADARVAPDGRLLTESEWEAQRSAWLPTDDDKEFVASLMGRVVQPGVMASWIAPPARGINGRPLDFEYVRFS